VLKNGSKSMQAVTETDDYNAMRLAGMIQDAATFNAIFADPGTGPGLPDLAEPGETIRGKPVFGLTGDWDASRPGNNNVRSQLDSGAAQDVSDGIITYAFFDGKHAVGLNNNPGYGEGFGYSPFTAAQRAAARIAINNWDELIAAKFVEAADKPGVSGWAQNTADILLANTWSGPAQAWAYFPGYGQPNTRIAGDVWIADPRFNTSNNELFPGGYGLQTLNHELGHSLGLDHPGNYNFGDDNDGDGVADPITYEGDAFYYQDNQQYTIMSYFDSYEAGNNQVDWNLMRFVNPSTPMVHDVWVIQQKYGADMTTRTGDTTYGFNATGDVTNEAMRFHSGEMHTIFTIWDAGGNDTLDLSGYYTPSVIDLRAGAYSSAGGLGAYNPAWVGVDPTTLSKADYLAFVNTNNAAAGFASRTAAYDLYFGGREGVNENVPWSDIVGKDWLMENNIGIAYGAVIENAIGGHGDDRINGNSANNHLTGGDGADTFIFADDASTDTITDFESGVDKIDLSELGVDASDVTFVGNEVFINTGANIVHIVSQGDAIQITDMFFG
jgi:serralysin